MLCRPRRCRFHCVRELGIARQNRQQSVQRGHKQPGYFSASRSRTAQAPAGTTRSVTHGGRWLKVTALPSMCPTAGPRVFCHREGRSDIPLVEPGVVNVGVGAPCQELTDLRSHRTNVDNFNTVSRDSASRS